MKLRVTAAHGFGRVYGWGAEVVAAPRIQAPLGIQIPPTAPDRPVLRRFLLRHATPDYRTRRQSTCWARRGA